MPTPTKKQMKWVPDEGADGYLIRSGDEVVGRVRSKGDADLICRARRVTIEMANQIAADTRRHRHTVESLRKDIRLLLAGLTDVADVLKRDRRPREVLAAREKVCKLIRVMKSRGYSG